LTSAALAQSPPDGARVLSAGGNVTLTWPGNPKQEYVLQVTLQGQPVFTASVKGTQAHLDGIRPGLYRWQVSALPGYFSFQLQTEPRLTYNGADSPPASRPGQPGRPGQNGANLRVTFTPGAPYHQLTVNRDAYLLDPNTQVTISAQGGRGGDGGPEIPPGPVPVDAGGTVIWMPGGAGRPPGRGGPGGAGGRVTAPKTAQPYLNFQLDGGPGGEPGGSPGPAGKIDWQ